MGKTVWDEKAIAEAIERKARGIQSRKLSDGAILRERDKYYGIYRSYVMANENSVEFYVAYKAYDLVAKERGLL